MNQEILFEIKKFCGAPSCLLFTDRVKLGNLLEIVKNLPRNSAIILREYDLNDQQRQNFAQEINLALKAKIPSQRPKIFIGKNWRLAKKLKADGVHFSDHDSMMPPQKLVSFLRRKFPKNFLISYACHGARSYYKASFSKLDLIVISPVFNTTSHFGTRPLGLNYLAEIASKKLVKESKNRSPSQRIYALGGINKENLRSVRKLGIGGFGAINLFEENL